jgi:K+-transporting ATPase ATPase C chain
MGINMNKINFWNEIKVSVLSTVVLLILVSGIYPVVVWGISQVLFPRQARGSLIQNDQGVPIGSELLAQGFTSAKYFHPRPSVAGSGYDPTSSGGSNLGQTSKALMDTIKARADRYRKENGLDSSTMIPGDAVTASASGLDPGITLDNALLQVARVAKARALGADHVEQITRGLLQGRDWGLFGEPRVNVLRLNLELDKLK